MNPLLAFATLAMVASCYALPVDMGTGIEIIKGADLNSWSQSFVLGGQPVQVGVGWKPDGTISVGGRIGTTVNGQDLPISVAVSSNYNNFQNFEYQVGTKFNEQVVGVLYGDKSGKIKYLINGWTPITSQDGKVTSLGASVEGEGAHPSAVSAGVSLDGQVIRAKAGIDENFHLQNINVHVGSDKI